MDLDSSMIREEMEKEKLMEGEAKKRRIADFKNGSGSPVRKEIPDRGPSSKQNDMDRWTYSDPLLHMDDWIDEEERLLERVKEDGEEERRALKRIREQERIEAQEALENENRGQGKSIMESPSINSLLFVHTLHILPRVAAEDQSTIDNLVEVINIQESKVQGTSVAEGMDVAASNPTLECPPLSLPSISLPVPGSFHLVTASD